MVDAGEQSASTATCSAEDCRESLLSPRSPSPPPIAVNHPMPYRRRTAGDAMPRKYIRKHCLDTRPYADPFFIAPDALQSPPRPQRRRRKAFDKAERIQESERSPLSPPRGRRLHRHSPVACAEQLDEDGNETDDALPTYQPPKPMRRFGILFTMGKPHYRRDR